MKSTIITVIVAFISGLLSVALLALNILSIVNDGPNFWNVFVTILLGSGILATTNARK